MESLPNELIILISEYLGLPDLINLVKTNWKYYKIYQESLGRKSAEKLNGIILTKLSHTMYSRIYVFDMKNKVGIYHFEYGSVGDNYSIPWVTSKGQDCPAIFEYKDFLDVISQLKKIGYHY